MKRLVVNSDDFGLCHSVNLGILKGFTEGILTQTTVMVPCPWFEEAAYMAKHYRIPCGVHLTAGCDWDIYRWGPVTQAKSLVKDDGCFYHTLEEVKKHCDPKDVEAEYCAQIELALSRGIKLTHIDNHMWTYDEALIAKLCRKYKLPTRLHLSGKYADVMFPFDTWISPGLSQNLPIKEKKAWFTGILKNLKDGYHFVCGHMGVPGPELESICSRDYPVRDWALERRVSDLELVCSPEIKELCRELKIELISLNEMKRPRK